MHKTLDNTCGKTEIGVWSQLGDNSNVLALSQMLAAEARFGIPARYQSSTPELS